MPLCSGIATFAGLGDQVGAPWGQKSVKWRPAGQIQGSGSKSVADQFCLAVEVMGTAREPPDRSPKPSQAEGQSLSKRQVI